VFLADQKDAATEAVRVAIKAIRDIFDTHIDTKWLHLALEKLPVDPGALGQIRDFLTDEAAVERDPRKLTIGLEVLEAFLFDLKCHLLPALREKLGISGLKPKYKSREREKFMMQEMVAYTFPHNLKQLGETAASLRKALASMGLADAVAPPRDEPPAG